MPLAASLGLGAGYVNKWNRWSPKATLDQHLGWTLSTYEPCGHQANRGGPSWFKHGSFKACHLLN
jgi:uncharacterized membrane protein YhdT